MITRHFLDRATSYGEYRHLLQHLLAQGKTTGGNQSETYIHYATLNWQRMQRLDKTTVLTDDLTALLKKISRPYTWLVLTEGWCGDAAQSLPVMAWIEKNCPNITLKLLLRDENLDLMDQYLTNGGRSIPKLICVDGDLKEKFNWGPRPAELQDLVMDLRQKGVSPEEKSVTVQRWYNADKTLSIQRELAEGIKQFMIG